jgi:hypothetical protein
MCENNEREEISTPESLAKPAALSPPASPRMISVRFHCKSICAIVFVLVLILDCACFEDEDDDEKDYRGKTRLTCARLLRSALWADGIEHRLNGWGSDTGGYSF